MVVDTDNVVAKAAVAKAVVAMIAVQPDEKQGQPPVPLYAKQGAYDGLVRTLLAAWKG